MKHPEFLGELRVGCICACHMTDDYESPQARERELRNVYKEKKFYEKRMASSVKTGNYTLKYKGGEHITIMRSKYGPGWGVIYAGEYC